MTSIAIIGTGKIGGEVAFLLARDEVVDHLVLYDINEKLARAQSADILDATDNSVTISFNKEQILDADVCIYTAGISRTPQIKTRKDLLGLNVPIAKECLPICREFDGLWITVTNPIDILNFYFATENGDTSKFIGFGCQLDTARLRRALSCDVASVVIGEHGEHMVPILRKVVDSDYTSNMDALREYASSILMNAAMDIIKIKGGTIFGPAQHICNLVEPLIKKDVVPSSFYMKASPIEPVSIVRESYSEIVGADPESRLLSIGTVATINLNGAKQTHFVDHITEWEMTRLKEAEQSIFRQIDDMRTILERQT
jgi:malate dehydrogenase